MSEKRGKKERKKDMQANRMQEIMLQMEETKRERRTGAKKYQKLKKHEIGKRKPWIVTYDNVVFTYLPDVLRLDIICSSTSQSHVLLCCLSRCSILDKQHNT